MTIQFFIPALAAIGTYGALIWMLSRTSARLPLDIPNDRSLHTQAIPRVGGIAILLSIVPCIAFLWSGVVAALAAALSAISFVDDKKGLPIALRFLAHGVAALVLAVWLHPALSYPALVCVVLATWWMTNLYNFMDGSDGLAGGMTLFGFGAYGMGAYLSGDLMFALSCGSIAAAASVFLIFNFHPARVFMGDAGSIPIGFLAAAMGSYGYAAGYWTVWFPLVVFSPFVVDATVVLLRRMVRGETFWAAHRTHFYQRLVKMGFGHRKTALAEYALMIGCAIAALAMLSASPITQMVTLTILSLIYVGLAFAIQRAWRRYEGRYA